MSTWYAEAPPPQPRRAFSLGDKLRIAWRGPAIVLVIAVLLVPLQIARLAERLAFGPRRPLSPYIVQAACRAALAILRLPVTASGVRMRGPGAVVANHSSWLDIFVLHARKNVFFVAKSEVSGWPGIGLMARGAGTVFIRRDPREAQAQTQLFEQRLLAGHRLLFFPEGTSTDGLRVLPFKTSLFGAFFSDGLRHDLQVQAVTVIYHAPPGEDGRFYGWWGSMDLAPHLAQVLAAKRQGRVELVYHAPVRVDAYPNRKSLARALETQVREAYPAVPES